MISSQHFQAVRFSQYFQDGLPGQVHLILQIVADRLSLVTNCPFRKVTYSFPFFRSEIIGVVFDTTLGIVYIFI